MGSEGLLIAMAGFVLAVGTAGCFSEEPGSRSRPAENLSCLDNGAIRIGVDLNLGGAITFLGESGPGRNIINSHDWGRQIQQSYYSGPRPFGQSHPGWKNWPWNPIGTGDVYGNPARVLASENDGKTLYVKSVPMQWALNNVPGECTFETWVSLEGKAAHVRCRLVNSRPDKTQYVACNQELPAVYTIGKLHKLTTYDGSVPFTGAPLKRIENAGPPWAQWRATENWAALVNDEDWGLGVFHAGVFTFCGGFHGQPNTGGPMDNPTGYISPFRQEILDHNIVYDYRYVLILGTLREIRDWVCTHCPADVRPDHVFARDRQHWHYQGASDAGWPIEGRLVVSPTGASAHLIGPETFFSAQDCPRLFVCAAHPPGSAKARITWRKLDGQDFVEGVAFAVNPDGRFHTYEINLASSPDWQGAITQLRFDPLLEGDSGGKAIEVAYISHRKRD